MSIKTPELDWLEGDVPRAGAFGDTYFSKAGGLAETRHVFLQGNGLPDRFQGKDRFTIAELGFGTGLNFLAALAALENIADAPKLVFVSFELFPMSAAQLRRALGAFAELGPLASALTEQWDPKDGWNRMRIAGADLLLGVGDARKLILDLETGNEAGSGKIAVPPVDAWFLDGFSPAKNPELWDPDLLKQAAGLTAPGGTLATYTAAGWVRRNLQAVGFDVEKVSGFAGKREMVVGRKA